MIQSHIKRRMASVILVFLLMIPLFCQGLQVEASNVKWGIDVSTFQGDIDWDAVATQIDFAMLRCGYGMDHPDQDDEHWEFNVRECERLEIPYGVYLYSYADTKEKAYSEALHVIRLLKGHSPSLPVYLDLEDDSILENCSKAQILQNVQIFCKTLSEAGYRPGIYANRSWWDDLLTSPKYDQWSRWIAEWNYECNLERGYTCWQYSCTGSIRGIGSDVDLNYWYGPFYNGMPLINEEVFDAFCDHMIEGGKCVNCGKNGGTFQDNFYWIYNTERKRLTLYGFGEIQDEEKYPWDQYLSEIQELVVEEGIESIPRGAFYKASNLQAVTLQDGIKNIGDNAFSDCTSLQYITLPDSIEVLGSRSFYHCISLTSITMPAKLKDLNAEAFSSCTKLKTLFFMGDSPVVHKNAFQGDNLTVIYPEEQKGYTSFFLQPYGGKITWMTTTEYTDSFPFTEESSTD